MKVFLAGGTGALGRPLTSRLVAAGHEVVAATRSRDRAQWLESVGAAPVLVEGLDDLRRAVLDARPEAVLDQLTDLPQKLGPFSFRRFYEGQKRIKGEFAPALLAAAREAGARMHLMQSIAFACAPGAPGLCSDDEPLWATPPAPWDELLPLFTAAETALTSATDLTGIVLRYGWFYGPGTHYAADGAVGRLVGRRQYPLIGSGDGVHSFIHVDDAADATVAAVTRGRSGTYNIVDDTPLPMREWLPVYAAALGAKPPWRIPASVARLVVGKIPVHIATTLRGADNRKAHEELGWKPAHPDVRDAFAGRERG